MDFRGASADALAELEGNLPSGGSSVSGEASGPTTRPLPPEPSTGLITSSSSRSSTSSSAAGSSSRQVSTFGRIGSSPR